MPPKRAAPSSASTSTAKKAKAAPSKAAEATPATTGRVTRGSSKRKTAEELMDKPKEATPVKAKKAEVKEVEKEEEAEVEEPKAKKAKGKAAAPKEEAPKEAAPTPKKDTPKKEVAPKKEAAKKEAAPKKEVAKKAAATKGKKKEPTPEPEVEEQKEEEGDDESFIGAFSSDDEGADSSDDESDAEDAAVKAAGQKIEVSTLPHARDDKSVAARLKKAAKKKGVERATLYLGRIPHGFYEEQMKEYFSQFGDVTRLRLARNPKTGASRHYAYLEFSSEPVAEIVADTMHNYLLMGHLLQCQLIPKDEVHPELWVGANKKFRKVPRARLEKVRNDKARTKEQQAKADAKLLQRQEERRAKIKAAGIDYDFEGH